MRGGERERESKNGRRGEVDISDIFNCCGGVMARRGESGGGRGSKSGKRGEIDISYHFVLLLSCYREAVVPC